MADTPTLTDTVAFRAMLQGVPGSVVMMSKENLLILVDELEATRAILAVAEARGRAAGREECAVEADKFCLLLKKNGEHVGASAVSMLGRRLRSLPGEGS